MKRTVCLALAAGFCVLAQARPIVIQETSVIQSPDPTFFFGGKVGIDGDEAVVYGSKTIPDPNGTSDDSLTRAFLFHRNGTTWTFVRSLADVLDGNEGDGPNSKALDMRNGVIAAAMQPMHIFERVNGAYVERTDPNGGGGDSRGDYVVIDGSNRIFFGGSCWGGGIFERDPDGKWTARASLPGDFCGSTDGAYGGPVALAGDWAVVSNPWNFDNELPGPALTFFHRASKFEWPQIERRVAPAGHSYYSVYMRGDELYAADWAYLGMYVYRRGVDDQWLEADRLRADGDYLSRSAPGPGSIPDGNFAATSQLVLHNAYDWDLEKNVVHVFKKDSAGKYAHVATLNPSGPEILGAYWFAISGNRVLVAGDNRVYYFDLPTNLTAPAAIQYAFPNTTVTGWTVLPGSQFALAPSGTTQVWRQSNTAGDAGAVLDAADWTNQSIQAEIKPTAVSTGGTDRWVGLMTRRTDASNYYYVTLRTSGSIQLKRRLNGVFTTLASTAYPWTLNRNYRLRLESVGGEHRVFVDGLRVLTASDATLKHGHAGLVSYRAAADYDNVIVSPAPRATIWIQTEGQTCGPTECPNRLPWGYGGGTWVWRYEGEGNAVLHQTVVSGNARSFVGAPTSNKDQIMEARVRLATFGTPQDPWAGIMLGYKGSSDYVYLSLRKSNALQLRRLRGGQFQLLGSVPFTVTPGTWYTLRLEQVANRLRGYVNGVQKFEVVQDQWNAGQVGLVTFAAAADYDDILALRP